MRNLRLLFSFYKLFAFVSGIITLACLSIGYSWGIEVFAPLFWFKVITLGLIYYYVNSYNKNIFFYFKNLGLSRRRLWVFAFVFDFGLFLVLLILAMVIR